MFNNDYNILSSTVIALNPFIQYNHWAGVQGFLLPSLVMKAFTTIIYLNVSFAHALDFQNKVHVYILSKWEQHLLRAFRVEMAFLSLQMSSIPFNKGDYETQVAYPLALIHSTCNASLQFEL